MTDRLGTYGVWTFCAMFVLASGCSRSPSRVHPPSIDPAAAGTAAMEQYDTDKDGKVAGTELENAPSLNAAIDSLDKDGDKAVSAKEVTERIEAWQGDTKVGLTSVDVTVKYRGQPLAGATVVFEPEKFLGTNIKPASGTTDDRGMTVPSIPNEKMLGLALGLYKVKITKKGMNIPAKYNEQTTLGAEVAPDAKEVMERGFTFDLK